MIQVTREGQPVEVLTPTQCWDLLQSEEVGRLAVTLGITPTSSR